MKPFVFKKFVINQSKQVFRVGTDAVLLGALTNVENIRNVLEIGSGTGIVSLMLAQRQPMAQVLALDINPNAVSLTEQNFNESPFSNRLTCRNEDIKLFTCNQKFDLIVSNPPYFEENNSTKDIVARQMIELNFRELIVKTSGLLSEEGRLSVIIPAESETEFNKFAKENSLFLLRRVQVFGIKGGILKRLILEFSFHQSELKEESLTIEKSPRQYSDQYFELTKEFHIFNKSTQKVQ